MLEEVAELAVYSLIAPPHWMHPGFPHPSKQAACIFLTPGQRAQLSTRFSPLQDSIQIAHS